MVAVVIANQAAARRRRFLTLAALVATGHVTDTAAPSTRLAHAVATGFTAWGASQRHGGSATGRPRTREHGSDWRLYQSPERFGEVRFRRYYRVSSARFKTLCEAMSKEEYGILRTRSRNGMAITIEQTVGACLRYLGSGSDLFSCALAHGMGESTLHQKLPLFLRAMRAEYETAAIRLPTAVELPAVMKKFENIQGFPNCWSAIDGTHFPWRPPVSIAAQCLNHKNYYSVNTLFTCGADTRIFNVVTGWPGGAHDARIFRESCLGRAMFAGTYPPPSLACYIQGVRVRPYSVVDAGFPNTGNGSTIKPYPGGILCDEGFPRHFNFKHSSTRMPVEHLNGVLKRRWRILSRGCEVWTMELMVDIIITCCILHNLCLDDNDVSIGEDWREEGDEEEQVPMNAGMDVNDNDAQEEEDQPGPEALASMHAAMLAIGTLCRC